MTPLRELPELVQDSELQVTIRDNITIHIEPLECRDEFSPQIWELKRTIGRGGDGTVFLQQKIEGPGSVDTIAVKQMSLNAHLASEDHDSKRYVRELEALAKFAQGRYSRYFVRSYGWYEDEGWLYICMEYCRHLDLGKHLKNHGPLSEDSARVIASQILQGLVQMHRNKIAHRDLKPANILIHRKRPEDDTWWVVLGDLGLSRRSGASSGTTTIRGTPSFMAPETIGEPFLGQPNSADPFLADMWCLGETISCALTGHGTFSNNEQLLRYQKRLDCFPDSALKGSGASSDVVDFIRSLMDVDPLRRLTAAQALNHPWIKTNHTSHTRTAGATTLITVQDSRCEASVTVKRSDNEPFVLQNQKASEVKQTTQASAQWTQTLPMQSNSTQASQNGNTIVINNEVQRDSLAPLDKSAGPELSPKLRTMHTKSTPALSQVQSLSSSEKTESYIDQGDRKLKEVPEHRASQLLEQDVLDSFKRWSTAEKLRIAEMQRDMARENNKIALSDLRRFSENFKLGTAVPPDLLPILSNDKEKQKQIEERQRCIEAPIKQESLIHKIEAIRASHVALTAPQKEKDYAVPELERTSPTLQESRYRHAATRSWVPVAAGGPSSHQEQLQPQSEIIPIWDLESETDSESGAETHAVTSSQLPGPHQSQEVRSSKTPVDEYMARVNLAYSMEAEYLRIKQEILSEWIQKEAAKREVAEIK